MKRSAGILGYRTKNNVVEVLLGHMGGPYWKGKEHGSWSIPKGEYTTELAIDAAIREFKEETGFDINKKELVFLSSVKQSSTNKLVSVFVLECDFDISLAVSNTFCLEWPPKSGKLQTFFEVDRLEWFSIIEAKSRILKGQLPFLEKLELYLDKKNSKRVNK